MNEEYLDPEDANATWSGMDEGNWEVLAIDPGGTTGWSVFCIHPEAMTGDPEIPIMENILWWTAGEFSGKQDDQIDQIIDLANYWPQARLVTEDFHVRQMAVLLDSAEINAVLRWALRPRYWVKQQGSLAMRTVTDDRQQEWGFWVPGKPHARDAIKHAITFAKRKKEQATREFLRERNVGVSTP